jgi:hypothetical protein
VAYLDISPMLVAMREQPATFSMSKGWLKHRPSRHRFWVGADVRVCPYAPNKAASSTKHCRFGERSIGSRTRSIGTSPDTSSRRPSGDAG